MHPAGCRATRTSRADWSYTSVRPIARADPVIIIITPAVHKPRLAFRLFLPVSTDVPPQFLASIARVPPPRSQFDERDVRGLMILRRELWRGSSVLTIRGLLIGLEPSFHGMWHVHRGFNCLSAVEVRVPMHLLVSVHLFVPVHLLVSVHSLVSVHLLTPCSCLGRAHICLHACTPLDCQDLRFYESPHLTP